MPDVLDIWKQDWGAEMVSPRCRERMVDRKVLYFRPERLTKALKWLHGREVGLFVVDEAQCLCLWRQDYERSYESLGLLRRKFPWTPILALTDVSDNLTQNYLFSQLWLKGWAVFEGGS